MSSKCGSSTHAEYHMMYWNVCDFLTEPAMFNDATILRRDIEYRIVFDLGISSLLPNDTSSFLRIKVPPPPQNTHNAH